MSVASRARETKNSATADFGAVGEGTSRSEAQCVRSRMVSVDAYAAVVSARDKHVLAH